jgi:hypothetical protein
MKSSVVIAHPQMDKNSNNNENKWVQKDGLVYDENGSVVSVAYKAGQ